MRLHGTGLRTFALALALAFDLDLDLPAPSGGRTQALRRGQLGKDAELAAPGHGWPVAAGPPEQCRSEGTPSLGEGPYGGARLFGSFCGV